MASRDVYWSPTSPRCIGSTWGDHERQARSLSATPWHTHSVGGQPVRSLFTPLDARADLILGTDCGRHAGRLKNPRTLPHARAPSACGNLRGSLRLQGVRAQSVPRSRRSATRATAAPRPERTKKAFDFVAWKGGVRCSDAVQAMGAWLARCGRVPVQRVARSHATVSGSPIREELGR